MQKHKVFIASSGRTLLLAEKLRDELQTAGFCEARLWDEEGRRRPGATIIEMLEEAARSYDFAVVILARDDVMVGDAGETLKARDNCIFEAGLFIQALGRERCFLVNSVPQTALPTDLGGVISHHFEEPDDLTNRDACAAAVQRVGTAIKDSAQRMGRMQSRPLSEGELLEREEVGEGKLGEGHVVVASLQPLIQAPGRGHRNPNLRVRKNMDAGVRYVYLVQGDTDGATITCKLLQAALLAPFLEPGDENVFLRRQAKMQDAKTQSKVVNDLAEVCGRDSLKIFFLPVGPSLQYRIHNASDIRRAVLYFRRSDGFIVWETGGNAHQFWKEERQKHGIESARPFAIFHGASGFDIRQGCFYDRLKLELKNFFPGIDSQVRKLCFEGKLD